ncbi:MAG: nitrous oxide reductase accessory protein NosL [Nitrospirae bacterium]|nr:nitrous oxide reductase accessory protein NosL [Nitrospirota bacterium]
MEVKKDDKCRVCGMFVAKYKEWIAQIVFKDGTYAVFDGPKDMLKYYFDLPKYNPSKKLSDIRAVYVTEYYSAKMSDAGKLFFVTGSDVNGPMGKELIPVDSEKHAREFLKDHGGKKILKFGELTKEDVN